MANRPLNQRIQQSVNSKKRRQTHSAKNAHQPASKKRKVTLTSQKDGCVCMSKETPQGKVDLTYRTIRGIPQGPAIEVSTKGIKQFNFINGVRQGQAVLTSKDGVVHFVNYNKNKLEGHAIIILKNKNTVNCMYQNGSPNGPATEIISPTERIVFNFANGQREGEATRYKDQTVTTFSYVNNAPHGIAKLVHPDGDTETYTYQHGILEGPATIVKNGEYKIECHYSQNLLHGTFVKTFDYGYIETSHYVHGVLEQQTIPPMVEFDFTKPQEEFVWNDSDIDAFNAIFFV